MKRNPLFINEDDVEKRLHDAINNNDLEVIDYFEQFGEDVRVQIRNAATYEQYLLCGYTDKPSFNQYGWIDNDDKIRRSGHEEAIFTEGFIWHCNIRYMQHPNGKWVASASYNFGDCGGSSLPGIWNSWYDSKEEAIRETLEHPIELLSKDGRAKAKKYLPILKKYVWNARQAALFADEPAPEVTRPTKAINAVQLTFDF